MAEKKPEKAHFEYDVAFQARMVRALFQDYEFALSVSGLLDHSLFEKRVHRWYAQEILAYAKKHRSGISDSALDINAHRAFKSGRLVKDRDGKAVIAFLDKITRKVKDRSFIKEEVYRFIKNQITKETILNGVQHLKAGDFDAIDREFRRVIEVQMAPEGGTGSHLVGHAKERAKRRKSWVKNGVQTGIRIDEYMKPGGLPPKQLGSIIGPPGSGKSNTLIHIGKSAIMLSQEPVLHFSFELAKEVLEDRYDSAFTGIKLNSIEDKGNPDKIRRFMEQLGEDLQGEPLIIQDYAAGTTTALDLENKVRQLESQAFYPGMIIADAAYLMKPIGGFTGDKYEDIGRVYIELRALAHDLNVPIWTAGQGNKASLGKEVVTMRELADSFQQAMHADVLVALCQTEKEKMAKRARFFMMKNRNGIAEFEIPVRLDWSAPNIIARGGAINR